MQISRSIMHTRAHRTLRTTAVRLAGAAVLGAVAFTAFGTGAAQADPGATGFGDVMANTPFAAGGVTPSGAAAQVPGQAPGGSRDVSQFAGRVATIPLGPVPLPFA